MKGKQKFDWDYGKRLGRDFLGEETSRVTDSSVGVSKENVFSSSRKGVGVQSGEGSSPSNSTYLSYVSEDGLSIGWTGGRGSFDPIRVSTFYRRWRRGPPSTLDLTTPSSLPSF